MSREVAGVPLHIAEAGGEKLEEYLKVSRDIESTSINKEFIEEKIQALTVNIGALIGDIIPMPQKDFHHFMSPREQERYHNIDMHNHRASIRALDGGMPMKILTAKDIMSELAELMLKRKVAKSKLEELFEKRRELS